MIRSTHLPRLIFLQGPPGCGKDTIADLLETAAGYRKEKFAQPIVDAMLAQFPTFFDSSPPRTIEDFKVFDLGARFRQDKTKVTGRDIMIAWSEQFMKPLFGQDILGTFAARRAFPLDEDWNRNHDWNVVFSDSGFADEAAACIEAVGADNCVILQVYRPGHNFVGDSRSYWNHPTILSYSYYNGLESVDDFKKDFTDFFNSTVYSYNDRKEPPNA